MRWGGVSECGRPVWDPCRVDLRGWWDPSWGWSRVGGQPCTRLAGVGWVPKPRRRVRQPTQAWGVLGTEEPSEEAGYQDDGGGGVCRGAEPPSSKFPQDMEKERETLQTWKERMGQELDRVVAFWMEHSHDQEHGCVSSFSSAQHGLCPT